MLRPHTLGEVALRPRELEVDVRVERFLRRGHDFRIRHRAVDSWLWVVQRRGAAWNYGAESGPTTDGSGCGAPYSRGTWSAAGRNASCVRAAARGRMRRLPRIGGMVMSGSGGFSRSRQARWRRPLLAVLAVSVLAVVALSLAACGSGTQVSASGGPAPANGDSAGAAISADGRFVAFTSDASNLVAGDTNRNGDVFVRDRVAGTTERVSVSSSGAQANGRQTAASAAISADGRFVAFDCREPASEPRSPATRTRAMPDVFVRDRVAGHDRAGEREQQRRPGERTRSEVCLRSARTGASSPSTRARRTWSPATRTTR